MSVNHSARYSRVIFSIFSNMKVCCVFSLELPHRGNSNEYTLYHFQYKLENVFVKHYAPNHMPDPKGEWSLKENNSELHYGICSKVYQFIYTLVCNYMPIMRILAKAVLQISRSKRCSYTKCLCPKKESNATGNLRNRFRS